MGICKGIVAFIGVQAMAAGAVSKGITESLDGVAKKAQAFVEKPVEEKEASPFADALREYRLRRMQAKLANLKAKQ